MSERDKVEIEGVGSYHLGAAPVDLEAQRRELKVIRQALKLALEARRAEDPPETDEAKKDETEYVDTPSGDLKLPRTPEFAHIIWKLEHGDPDTYMGRFAAEKVEQAEQERSQDVEDK